MSQSLPHNSHLTSNFSGKLSLPITDNSYTGEPTSIKIGEVYPVNRFASGVQEKCGTALYLPADDYIVPRRFSQTTQVIYT